MERIQEILKAQGISTDCTYKADPRAYTMRACDEYNAEAGTMNEVDGYNCDICKNKGYIKYTREERGQLYEYMRPCECMKVRRSLRNLKISGLANTEKWSFEAYETETPWQKTVKERALEYAQEPLGRWFFIGGQTGAGKTHICTAIATFSILEKRVGVYYMQWRDAAVRLKGQVIDDPAAYAQEVNQLKTVDMLYIDDLFKTGRGDSPTKGDINLAFEVLNARYHAGRPTVISSEFTLDDILDIDEAIGGRIAEKTEHRYLLSIGKDRAKNYRMKGVTQL